MERPIPTTSQSQEKSLDHVFKTCSPRYLFHVLNPRFFIPTFSGINISNCREKNRAYRLCSPKRRLFFSVSGKNFKNQVFILRSAVKMKKMVLKLSLEDEKSKRRVFKAVAGVEGVDSVTVDMKEKKITVIGDADPVFLTSKLRKFGYTELLSVGPAKEEKKEAPKQEQKKDDKKSEPVPTILYYPPNYNYRPYEYNAVAHDDYNSCTIC